LNTYRVFCIADFKGASLIYAVVKCEFILVDSSSDAF